MEELLKFLKDDKGASAVEYRSLWPWSQQLLLVLLRFMGEIWKQLFIISQQYFWNPNLPDLHHGIGYYGLDG